MTLDIPRYLAAIRLGGLVVGPGGEIALAATTPGRDGKAFQTEIRSIDPDTRAARTLVAAAPGTSPVGYTAAGDLLFLAKRDDAAAPEEDKVGETGSLWLLPAHGGEARRIASAPDGIGEAMVARHADVIVVKVGVFAGATDLAADRAQASAREKAGTTALLWDSYPIRYWDHSLAPRDPRLFVTDSTGSPLRDLTGPVGRALVEEAGTLTPDGRQVITGWATPLGKGEYRHDLVAIDVADGSRTTLVAEDGWMHLDPTVSPDGRWLAYTRASVGSPTEPSVVELWLLELANGARRRLAPDLDRWPEGTTFTAAGDAVLMDASDEGHHSVWRIPVEPDGASPVRLVADGAYGEVRASGAGVYAMRSRIDAAPELVRLDEHAVDQHPVALHAEAFDDLPGVVEEVHAAGADGTPLHAWLVRPNAGDEPAPLVVFIHGGPRGSWNAWQWRWQPFLLAARGYAVLLPDPALSLGYGQAMIDRGWAQWGGVPYDDVLTLTDAAVQRPDIDAERTAVMGGSYGGYLTNWTITHTDRFRCAVTHASVWDLTPMGAVSDDAVGWRDEFGHPREDRDFYAKWSPSTYADAIVTPTLVIHGERDFRVPIGEGIAIYTELQLAGVPSQLLYFPDENHWVLKPGDIAVWYDTVLAWLDHWVLGEQLRRPDLV